MTKDTALEEIFYELYLEDFKLKCLKDIEMLIAEIKPADHFDEQTETSYWDNLVDFENQLKVLADRYDYILRIEHGYSQKEIEVIKSLSIGKSDHKNIGQLAEYTLTKKDGGLCPMVHSFLLKSYKSGIKSPRDIGFSFIELEWDFVSLADYKYFLSLMKVVLAYDVSEYQKTAENFIIHFNQKKRIRRVTENVIMQFFKELEEQFAFKTEINKEFEKANIQITFGNAKKLCFEIFYRDFADDMPKIRERIKAESVIR